MERTTIKDIARECGVSLSTVSLVLNNSPRISERTREIVLSSVKKHGYQPNIHARGLASQTSHVISVVVPHLNHVFADIYTGEIVSGIYDQACQRNYKVLLDIANDNFIRNEEYLNLLKSRRVDGMLFISSSVRDEYLRAFEKSDYAFLLVNHYFPKSSLNYLGVDYKDSARQAADHLVQLGHRSIGVIAGINTYTGVDLRDAFLGHCLSRGLASDRLCWADGGKDWSQEGGFEAARELLTNHPELTAIMASNDRMAMGAMRYCHTCGLRIPQDISILGVDDIPEARYTTPGLTTIRHELYRMGQLACERLIDLFLGEIPSCRELLPVTLVVRESTGPARAT
jgi:LacI family transcriptional regulator